MGTAWYQSIDTITAVSRSESKQMKKSEVLATREKARQILADAGFTLTCAEAADIEVIDCGLNQLATEGLELVTYINTDRYCAKELVIFPGQTCPEHRHPPIDGDPGKQETFRCRRGLVWLYVEGTPSTTFQATVPKGSVRCVDIPP